MKRKVNNPIHPYFGKVPKPTFGSTDALAQPSTSFTAETNTFKNDLFEPSSSSTTTSATNLIVSSEHLNTFDIGLHVGSQISEFTSFGILQNHWEPPKGYTFPFSVHNKGGKEIKRFLGRNHIESKHWLVLSDVHKGLYCKYCVLFSSEFGGHQKGSHLQSFVTKPVTTFAKLLGKDGSLESHERNEYHKKSVEAGKNFIKTYLHPENAVVNQVVTHRIEKIAENR